MRNARVWLVAAVVVVALGVTAIQVATAPSAGAAQGKEMNDHWRHHDGHWSYYHQGDKCWYYTDGKHWYCEDGGRWKLYRFDKQFGRERFEKGEYKLPGVDIKIDLPTHAVFQIK
jgi:hypothetical protein